jgi:pyroglutamyl-peptidase
VDRLRLVPDAYLTGFAPFGGRAKNRSWEIARRVELPDRMEVVQLPVDFARLRAAIAPLLATRPQALLLLGEAPIREVAVEEVALNRIHTIGSDNAGIAPRGVEIVAGAPLALRAGWEAEGVAEAMRSVGVPARASFHAGTFACNAALYHALHMVTGTAIGFLHLPRNYSGPGTEIASLVKAVRVAMNALLPGACPPPPAPTP